jgi:ElaB/YqjD/DUF883 family membrane-anchored ribosome-binding protein
MSTSEAKNVTGLDPTVGSEADSHTPQGRRELPTELTEIQRDIEQTRAEFSDTVEALAGKADVSGRVKEKVGETRENVKSKTEKVMRKVHVRTDEMLAKLPPPTRERLDQVTSAIRRRPLQATAIAVGAGLAMGWLFRRR